MRKEQFKAQKSWMISRLKLRNCSHSEGAGDRTEKSESDAPGGEPKPEGQAGKGV